MIQDILSADITFIVLKWLILLLIWLFLAYGLRQDGAKIRKFHDASITTAMLQIMHRRNLHIFGLVSMLLVVLLTNDLHKEAEASSQAQAAAQEAPTETPAAEVSPQVSAHPATNDNAQFSIPQNTPMPFSEITQFNETNGKQQAYIDYLKQRYETWLITYYYLQKCNKVDPEDLDMIMAALRKGLQTAHADNAVESNIMTAANGSYKEMYKDIPCDAAHITSTKSGYDSSMQQIRSSSAAAPSLAPSAQPGQGIKQP